MSRLASESSPTTPSPTSPSVPEEKNIYWLASPLAIDQCNDQLTKIANPTRKRHLLHKPMARYIAPENEIHVFRKIQHWTLEIDGKCYELSPDTKKKLKLIKKSTEMVKPHWIEWGKWRGITEVVGIEPERRLVGKTRMGHEEIMVEGLAFSLFLLPYRPFRFGRRTEKQKIRSKGIANLLTSINLHPTSSGSASTAIGIASSRRTARTSHICCSSVSR